MRIEPAGLAFDGEGTPFSPAYGDVYHSGDSGPGQARHVFVDGNGLPRRWAQACNFTILETGFGLGLNFLATWREWRADPARCQGLHYVSIEKHPFDRDALRTLHLRYAEFAPLAAQLQDAWPPLVAGMHRLHFEGERLTLTLAFGEAIDLVRRLRLHADAIYLDGFAPRCNPDMWSPQLMRGLARLARPGTTVATYSSAGMVRQGLEAAGFAVEKCPGFGRKRDMLRGSFAPRWPSRSPQHADLVAADRHAIVIGAGLAGAAVSERLARRGWQIDLMESRALPAPAAATRYAGVFHPHLSRDDCILSRAARNGFLYAVSRWLALERAGQHLAWARCGVLQLARGRERDGGIIAPADPQTYPDDYAQYLEQSAAELLSGCRLPSGGWWFPGGGWMRPQSLIAAQLAAAASYAKGASALTLHADTTVHAICRSGDNWQATAADGSLIAAAPVLVLANANDLTRLAGVAQTLQRIRGQISYVPAENLKAPEIVLTGRGYVLP
ncbi:MAG: tRNA (5-methylaminomethyl-2-thiouridine)(34)-methyltransferase MnmD, partial [Acidobacteriota bacterium]